MNIETQKELAINIIDKMQKSQDKKEIDLLYKELDKAIWCIYDYKVMELCKRQGVI